MCFRIALLTKSEWEILTRCYKADYGVYLYFDDQGIFTISKPGNLSYTYLNSFITVYFKIITEHAFFNRTICMYTV